MSDIPAWQKAEKVLSKPTAVGQLGGYYTGTGERTTKTSPEVRQISYFSTGGTIDKAGKTFTIAESVKTPEFVYSDAFKAKVSQVEADITRNYGDQNLKSISDFLNFEKGNNNFYNPATGKIMKPNTSTIENVAVEKTNPKNNLNYGMGVIPIALIIGVLGIMFLKKRGKK